MHGNVALFNKNLLNYDEMLIVMDEFYPNLKDAVLINRIQRMGFENNSGDLKPLSVDGKAGPKTKGGIYLNPVAITTKVAIVALKELMAGSQEIEGSNSGSFVRKYFRIRGTVPKNYGPYCAGFASYCLDEAYPELDTPYILGAIRMGNAVAASGGKHKIAQAKPDDMAIWKRETDSPGTGHIGVFVTDTVKVDGVDYKFTIEGNVGNFPAPTRVFALKVSDPSRGEKNPWLFAARFKP
jgi:hypothetical protein